MNPFPEPETSDLERSACVVDGCRCSAGTSPGLYCGYCAAVISCPVRQTSCEKHVHQCSSGGRCCNYGLELAASITVVLVVVKYVRVDGSG